MNRPLFSILHTSARPEKWREIYNAWINAAVNPDQVEYVICCDKRWGFTEDPLRDWELEREAELQPANLYVWNDARRCYVDGVNTAAKASSGRILIVNADDQYPCEGWDEKLAYAILQHDQTEMVKRQVAEGGPVYFGDGFFLPVGPEYLRDALTACAKDTAFVVEVSTGTPSEHDRGILVMPILSRARYERLGYVFYPEYESMYADNEFCEHARQDGAIIDARHLLFPHRHPLFDASARKPGKDWRETDAAYSVQNRDEAYKLGEQLIQVRRAEHFDPTKRHDIAPASVAKKPTIALCLSGENFHAEWLDAFLNLYGYLVDQGWKIWRAREYTSNVYVTREQIRKVMMEVDPQPDLYLWIDDDNPAPTPQQFALLVQALDQNPDIDGVTGWCWIYNKDKGVFYPSCGMWSPDNLHWRPFDPVFFPQEQKPRITEATGFPCFLMRHSALVKAGNRPFLPIIDELMDHGLSGEDHAFCHKAQEGGAKFLVEPRVRVRHIKICDATPDVPKLGNLQEPKIAVMMRVKNESRWIERCINSVIPLAGENVYVMDDESTDDTLEIARATGVNVYADPFAGKPLDETRDKDWLLTQVRAACDPDWVLCIDGDEELEPDGAEKILRILSTNPAVDVFSLGFLFLWDTPDQIRLDGRYHTLQRESLFRPKNGVEFRSYYEDKDGGDPKCHVGLHCGNAPNGRAKELVIKPLNVFLLHYGYLFRDDRVRKYNWYRNLDPNNPYEDDYKHMVIGDLPEFPADFKAQFGGPLKLVRLPKSMVPKFAVMPEPLRDEVTA